MAIKRSHTDKVRDGHKAYEYRIAQYGPADQMRAAEQSVWTKKHPNQDKADNPHLRRKVYTPADLARAKRFAAWHKENSTRGHSENPHVWSNAGRHTGT
jgi:hypothetical protein